MDYKTFVKCSFDMEQEPYKKQRRLMLVKNIVDSIMVIENRKKGDFEGLKLIDDFLKSLNVTKEDLS